MPFPVSLNPASRRLRPSCFWRTSASDPMNPPDLSSFTIQPSPASSGVCSSSMSLPYSRYATSSRSDMDEEHTPLEAGLGWIVKLDKPGGFIGSDALVRQKQEGLKRRLAGFKLTGKGIARHGYPVLKDGRRAGEVTSGTMSPVLKEPI